ncbi:MAG: transposase [Deltaproteobacteria bacterium]|nr:transposase [Deltaproteobacteria bacterium]
MPWKTSSLLEARQHFVRTALRGFKSVAQLCHEARISCKTGFKWLRRFRASGGPGLRDHSRRPQSSPRRTAARWLVAIRGLRRKHASWGGKKIYARLRHQHPRAHLPKPRTITDWLQRFGGKGPRRNKARPGPKRPRPALTIPRVSNEVWTVDFKGWFRTRDGQRVNPLTVRDLFSRFILGIRLLSLEHTPVQQCFQALFLRYGQPKIIRVDHGAPFAGVGPLDLSRLSAWWLRLGIRVEFTRRACPQDNGAHEQMHRIYKADTASPPAATPRAQQRRSTRWANYYNHQRPHEALGQRVPATLYHKSRQHYRGYLRPLQYPRPWQTRRVSSRGFIHWRGRARGIGRAFAGENIGLKRVREGVHEVYFERQLIGVLVDTDPGGMRPVRWGKNPPRTKRP